MLKMFNFDDVTKENIKEHNLAWPQILIIHTEYQQLEVQDL